MLKKFIFRLTCKLRIVLYRVLSSSKVEGPILYIQPVHALGLGKIVVKKNVTLGYFPSPHFFSTYCYLEVRSKRSEIRIGENTHINNGFVAIAEQSSIIIGDNCLIGTRVEIYDSDFHVISAKDRLNGIQHLSKSVIICNDAFIGSNVKILKGVIIGEGAVIANGSVVTKDIPAYCIAGGVPAVVIKKITDET